MLIPELFSCMHTKLRCQRYKISCSGPNVLYTVYIKDKVLCQLQSVKSIKDNVICKVILKVLMHLVTKYLY